MHAEYSEHESVEASFLLQRFENESSVSYEIRRSSEEFTLSESSQEVVTRCCEIARGYSDSLPDQLDRPLDSILSSFAPSLCFAPATLAKLVGSNIISSKPPLLPSFTFNTIFKCAYTLEVIVALVLDLLSTYPQKINYHYSQFEFSWECKLVISEGNSVEFCIRLYSAHLSECGEGQISVEFQRLQGDRIPYLNVYNACRQCLVPEESVDSMVFNASQSLFDLTSCFDSPASESESSEDFEPNSTALKEGIVKQLSVQTAYSNILENIQMISSLYTEKNSFDLAPVDTELFFALCKVARKFSTNTRDWIFQSAVIAAADMLSNMGSCDGCIALLSSIKSQENIMTVLQTMCNARDDSGYVTSKSKLISTIISSL